MVVSACPYMYKYVQRHRNPDLDHQLGWGVSTTDWGVSTMFTAPSFTTPSILFLFFLASRMEAAKQRKVLSARRRARGMLDEALLRHRVGQPTPSEIDLTNDAMQVLRPNSRAGYGDQPQVRGVGGGEDGGVSFDASHETYGDASTTHVGAGYHALVQRRPSSGGIAAERGGLQATGRRKGGPVDVDGAGVIPLKPEGSRPRSRQPRNRRLRVNDGGKTVVVLASVPTVVAEVRTRRSAAEAGPLFGSKSSHSVLSTSLQHNRGSRLSSPSVAPAQASLPWPMGRRCW